MLFEDNSIFSISSERTGKIPSSHGKTLATYSHVTKLAISGASIAEVANSLDHASYKAAMALRECAPCFGLSKLANI